MIISIVAVPAAAAAAAVIDVAVLCSLVDFFFSVWTEYIIVLLLL